MVKRLVIRWLEDQLLDGQNVNYYMSGKKVGY